MGAGIPGFWVDGAGGGDFSAACRAALAACGINPDNFGTYTQRLNAAGKARNDYREHLGSKKKDKKNHEVNCKFRAGGLIGSCECHSSPAAKDWYAKQAKGDPDNPQGDFLLANSQSGHEGQNAFSQTERGDPCSNVTPPPGQSKDGGSYGYDDSRAGCTDHYGKSTDRGTTHYEVTRKEDTEAETIKTDKTGRVTENQIGNAAESTGRIAAEGPTQKKFPDVTPKEAKEAKARSQSMNDAQSAQADALSKKEGVKPNSKCSKAQQKKNKEKAAKCMRAHWKMMVDKMRMDSIDKHSEAAKSDRCKEECKAAGVKKFSDLPPKTQKAIVNDPKVKAATEKKQAALAKKGANDNGEKGKENKNPSMDDCRAYQANWLATAGWGKGKNGSLPAFSGRKPGPGTKSQNGENDTREDDV